MQCGRYLQVEIVSGLIALAGVAVGAVLSHLLARSNADRTWQRESEAKLVELRRSAYVEFAQAVKDEVLICRRMAMGLGIAETTTDPIALDAGIAALASSSGRRSATLESVILVGSENLIVRARVWQHALWRIRTALLDHDTLTSESFQVLYRKCGVARDEYYSAARADLGVGGKVEAVHLNELTRLWERLPAR